MTSRVNYATWKFLVVLVIKPWFHSNGPSSEMKAMINRRHYVALSTHILISQR